MINRLTITSGHKDSRSYLKDTFFTRPFRIANIGQDKSDPSLYLMIMSSSPGILDKDQYDINILVESNSSFLLESQSYQRLFNMQQGAEQKMTITLQPNSVFSYIQHPIVPHEHSIFKGHSIIEMADNCSFTFGEIITCGRKHSGEIFRYSKFQNLTEIFHNRKMMIKDHVLLQPNLIDMHTLGQMESYTHQATLFHVNTGNADLERMVEETHHFLQQEEDIAFGVSQPLECCMIIRMLGNGGEQMYNAFRHVQRQLWLKDNTNKQLPEQSAKPAKERITTT